MPLTDPERVTALEWPTSRVDMVLDTDTYNEIDDQFALAYAALSPERIRARRKCCLETEAQVKCVRRLAQQFRNG